MLTFNIVEIACSKELNKLINKTNSYTQISMNDFRHGMSDIVDEASGVFTKIISKMIAHKKLIGLDSNWN